MNTKTINLSHETWPGILTVCGQDEGEYRENVCYGAMFDYGRQLANSQMDRHGFYSPGWFELDPKLYMTTYVNRHNRTVSKGLGEWWMDEVIANFIPFSFLQDGLVHITPITDDDWPSIDPDHQLLGSDILWDDEKDRDDIDRELTGVVKLSVSQKLCGRLQLAIGALFRYMTECGGNIIAYKALRDHTKLTPSQAFAIAGFMAPTDGHGIGSFKSIGAGPSLESFRKFSLPACMERMQNEDMPFHRYGDKEGMIDHTVTLVPASSGDKWALIYGGYHLYEGGKVVAPSGNMHQGVKIGDTLYYTHNDGAINWLFKHLQSEGLL